MIAVKYPLVLFPVALFAAGCSHGHDAAAPVTPGVQITPANAQEVATLALRAAFGLANVGSVTGGLLTHQPAPAPALLDVKAIVEHHVDEMVVQSLLLPASISDTVPGPGGGQVIHTWEDSDGSGTITTGDSFVSAYTDYQDGAQVLNGVVTVDPVAVFGQPPDGLTWGISGRMNFVNLEVAVGTAEPQAIAGTVRFTREHRQTVDVLDLDLDTGLVVGTTALQAGTTIAYDVFPAEYGFAMSARGAVQVDGVDGLIEFETRQVFTGLTLLGYPWAGSLEVRGAGGGLITVTMVDYTSALKIEIDADGDGEAEETVDADWTTL